MSWKRACLVALAVLLASPSTADAQRQTRIISGTVIEKGSNEVIVGATVIVKGTSNGAITELDGSFTIADVSTGPVVLEVISGGHETQELNVGPNDNQLKIEMKLGGETIVLSGRAPTLRKNLANGASVVRGDALTEVPNSTLGGALQGKVAGANIQSNSGAPGGGIQVSLRGVSTIAGRTDVLYVVDGVIVSDTAIASGANAVTAAAAGSNASNQDNPVNRIADLNPNDIENVEILKGAAAAALYGSKASNGVVIITTKRGRAGKTKVTVTQRVGMTTSLNTLGARVWNNEQEVIDAFGEQIGPYQTRDLFIEDDSGYIQHDHERELFQKKLARETSVSMSGGTDRTTYLVSASVRDEPGLIKGTGYNKETARLAIDQKIGDRLSLSVTSNFIHSKTSRGLTNNDNNSVSHYMVLSSTPNFIDLRKFDDGTYPINPFVGSLTNPLQTVQLMSDAEDVYRNITSFAGNLDVWSNDQHAVRMTGVLGVDRFQSRNSLLFPRDLHFEPVDGLVGTAIAVTAESLKFNWGLNLFHTFEPTSKKYKSVASFGAYYDQNEVDVLRVVSQDLSPGPGTIDSGASLNAQDTRLLEKDLAFSLQEELQLLDERLNLLVAVLADRSSNNGDPDKFFFYPKASAAYRTPIENDKIDLLRARLAYGQTGNKPFYGAKFTSLLSGNTIDGNGGVVLSGAAGNPDIRPERQVEYEGGFDLSALNGRALVEFTLYHRSITDLLLQRALAPSTGFTSQVANVASLRNQGIELLLQVTPVRRNDFQWLSRTVFSINRSKITQLDVDSFGVGGFGVSLGRFQIEEGKSATQIIGNILADDGTVSQGVVGDAEPDFRVSFVNDFSWKGLTLHTLLDWQQGSDVINLTKLLYDFGQNTSDFVEVGADRLNQWRAGDTGQYIEDASFLKVREISLSYKLPQSLVEHLGPMEDANLVLSGRNLFTFTNYSGLDPEVSNFGRQSIARNIDVAPYPPSRSFWFSVDASF